MDFYQITVKEQKSGPPQLYPDWTVGRSSDLMVRGRSFYAIWDEEAGLWSTDEYDVQRLVDKELKSRAAELEAENGVKYSVLNLRSFNTQIWATFRKFMQNISDNSHPLDENLTFANTEVTKNNFASKRLPYALEPGECDAWHKLVGRLYSDEERAKIEWAIGAVVAGQAKRIQKFLVFYGPAGSGKSTILNIIGDLFEGYVAMFDAKALGSNNNAFATEVFRSNPLVAIQHDGDLSRIEDNTKLNSIVSHEDLIMNEKYKPSYSARVNAFLFMGTNQPVKISDAKSGIIRRLIDVHPTGDTIEPDEYHHLMEQIKFELGAIAYHCLEVFKRMGKNAYNSYRPIEMMLQTDVFYNFVEAYYDIFKKQDGVSLKQAYELYKEYCSETGIEKLLPQYKFREELRNYFADFHDRFSIGGEQIRSYYSGFKELTPPNPFKPKEEKSEELRSIPSKLDEYLGDSPAQYAKSDGNPKSAWSRVSTTLRELDSSKLHYVKVPKNHIVIDFDLVDEDGEKDLALNIEAAKSWPPTYAEVSKSGRGLHLHYLYSGDVEELSSVYDVGIEVKTLLGNSSLRRKLTLCNNLEVVKLTSGLPKKEKPVQNSNTIQTEKGLRDLIERNLRKEIHPGTKSSVDFIHKILQDAYDSGLSYDLNDMRSKVLSFAAGSSNQSLIAIKTVQSMKFKSEDRNVEASPEEVDPNQPLVIFDVEVYSNLFVVCWKFAGSDEVVKMLNPTPQEIEPLFKMRLVGFNNRRYDNHILYARYLGYDNEALYRLSQKLVNNDNKAYFGKAFDISYADIYDFSSLKQTLKKFQIQLGLRHMEMDIPWDQPVPDDMVEKVVEYCCNDVISQEAVLEARNQDFVARLILAEISGLSPNHTTPQHTAKIIFGDDKKAKDKFVYTDLSKEFPGYIFNGKVSEYRGETVGEGGYVYGEDGIYTDVALLDVASMHPTSIEVLGLFGPYTKKFSELKEARLAIKHKDYKRASSLLDGKLGKFLGDAEDDVVSAEALSFALKIVINIVYGLTSAKFDNPFRDIRNVDNIVAKRGALFMIDLKHAVQEKGYTVAHIKTDSIKIPDADQEIIDFVTEFGKKYGYDFEHEGTYDKFCLVNDAVYIAREGDKWVAVGAQFQHPYVFKKLFTGEEIEFEDVCESRSVKKGAIYLDFNPDPLRKTEPLVHIGKTGSFVPVASGGARLLRVDGEKQHAVTGTKKHLWITREMAEQRDREDQLEMDMSYFENLANSARDAIEYLGPFDKFIA